MQFLAKVGMGMPIAIGNAAKKSAFMSPLLFLRPSLCNLVQYKSSAEVFPKLADISVFIELRTSKKKFG